MKSSRGLVSWWWVGEMSLRRRDMVVSTTVHTISSSNLHKSKTRNASVIFVWPLGSLHSSDRRPNFKLDMAFDHTNGKANLENELWTKSERRVWVAAMFAGCAMIYACRITMSLCIVSISQEFGWQKTDSGLVLSAFYWGYTLTQVLGGYWSDRIGGETVMSAAAAGWTLLIFSTPYLLYISPDKTTTLTIIVIARILLGCFQGIHYPSLSSLLYQRVSEKNRGSALGGSLSGSKFGTLISGCVGSLVLEYYGWHNVFYSAGTCALAWFLFLRFYLIASQRKKSVIVSVHGVVAEKRDVKKPVPWLVFFRSPAFWVVVLGQISFTAAFHILINWLPTYFAETYPGAKGWVFNVVPWLIATPLTAISGLLADKMIHKGYTVTFVRKFFTILTLAGSSSFLVLTALTSSYAASLFFMTATLACLAMHTAGVMANVQDIAQEFTGSLFGLVNTAGAVSGVVFVYVVGYILEMTQNWGFVFLLTAAVGYIGAIFYSLYGKGNPIV